MTDLMYPLWQYTAEDVKDRLAADIRLHALNRGFIAYDSKVQLRKCIESASKFVTKLEFEEIYAANINFLPAATN